MDIIKKISLDAMHYYFDCIDYDSRVSQSNASRYYELQGVQESLLRLSQRDYDSALTVLKKFTNSSDDKSEDSAQKPANNTLKLITPDAHNDLINPYSIDQFNVAVP